MPADPLPAAVETIPVRRFARAWSVVGPFPNPEDFGTELSPALDSVYGPERDPDLGRTYVGLGGRTVSWKAADAPADGYLDLYALFHPTSWVAAYAQTFLYSPDAREVTLLLGADDAAKAAANAAYAANAAAYDANAAAYAANAAAYAAANAAAYATPYATATADFNALVYECFESVLHSTEE